MRDLRRGYALLLCLLLTVLLVGAGMAFLGMRTTQYRGVVQSSHADAALGAAEAGLADAKMKFWKDPDFPPPGSIDQDHFCYSEELRDMDGTVVGGYRVDVDLRTRPLPYGMIVVKSTGLWGPPGEPPLARRVLRAELDVSPKLRDGSGANNPRYYDWSSVRDEAGW